MKKKLTAVEYIEENFSSSKTLGELKQIIKDAKVLEKEQLEFAQSKIYSEEEVLVLLELAVKRGIQLEAGIIPYQRNVTKEWFETIKKK